MRTLTVRKFNYGIIDTVEDRAIPRGAASRALGWLARGDRIELAPGRFRLGAEDTTAGGKITGLGIGLKADGTQVLFRTYARKVEYYTDATDVWTEIGSNAIAAGGVGKEHTINPYNSIAGAQVWIGAPESGMYKVMVHNLGTITDNYLAANNFRGYFAILNHRMVLWQRAAGSSAARDFIGVYYSYIDKDELSDYTSVTGENIGTGNGTTKTFTDTLADITGRRTAHNISATDGTETFTDNGDGTLTGTLGGTGTINYATGAISVTFNTAPANLQAITADYFYEDATSTGIMDFTKSTPRTAGQGARFPQSAGGGRLMAVVNFDNVDFCFHEKKSWAVTLTRDDTAATNLPFREKLGIPSIRAVEASREGVYLVNSADETDVNFEEVAYDRGSSQLITRSLSKAFTIEGAKHGINLSDYRFNLAAVKEVGELILFAARHKDQTQNNRLFVYHKKIGSIDVLPYWANVIANYNGVAVLGDSLSNNVYEISGFDDDGSVIENFWEGEDDDFDFPGLKKVKKLVLRGYIGTAQKLKVSVSLNNATFVEIGDSDDSDGTHHYAIEGNASYVDKTQKVLVGSQSIGRGETGGGTTAEAYYYERQISVNQDRFEFIKRRFEAMDVGYVSVNECRWRDIRLKSTKVARKYR